MIETTTYVALAHLDKYIHPRKLVWILPAGTRRKRKYTSSAQTHVFQILFVSPVVTSAVPDASSPLSGLVGGYVRYPSIFVLPYYEWVLITT
jgi:hypothetical protein